MCEHDPYFVSTKSSRVHKSHFHEVAVHHSEVKKKSKSLRLKETHKPLKSQELSMKQVRFEIYKFTQSALSSTDKQKSKIELAVKLGARPPKNKAINYKELKENKKKELEEARQRNELYNMPIQNRTSKHNSKLNKSALRQKRRIGSGILNVYGKVNKKDLRPG